MWSKILNFDFFFSKWSVRPFFEKLHRRYFWWRIQWSHFQKQVISKSTTFWYHFSDSFCIFRNYSMHLETKYFRRYRTFLLHFLSFRMSFIWTFLLNYKQSYRASKLSQKVTAKIFENTIFQKCARILPKYSTMGLRSCSSIRIRKGIEKCWITLVYFPCKLSEGKLYDII